MKFKDLTALYHYLDELVSSEYSSSEHSPSNEDELFASSYVRGFITLSASQYGDDSQSLTKTLADDISQKILAAKSELTPQDQTIVNNFWLQLQTAFVD